VVLGGVGKNFGAGMTNGAAYVLDEDGALVSHCNGESVALAQPSTAELDEVLALVRRHQRKTGSIRALLVLERWAELRTVLKKVVPVAAAAPVTAAVPKAAAAARVGAP
jgi:glutamate synthase domain-containing protein 3